MTVLVTGCAGFIGSHLTEALLADGDSVVGVDCLNDNYARTEKLENLERSMDWSGFRFLPLDLSRGDLNGLMDDCDTVFHLAAEPGVRPSFGERFARYVNNNVHATQRLLEAALAAGPRRFVYASSSSVYGQVERLPVREDAPCHPQSPYGATKLAGEHLCEVYRRSFGLDAVSLRFFTVYGPRQRPDMAFERFIRAALAGDPISLYGDGSQTRDFTYVHDVVAAIRLAAKPGAATGPFNVAGGSRTSLAATLDLLADLSGRKLAIESGPPQSGDVTDTAADIALIRDQLGFEPAVRLEEGLAAQLEATRVARYE